MAKGLEEAEGEEGPGGESGEGGVEPVSYWKRKETLLRSSTVSLGTGEKFSSEIALVFSGRTRSTEVRDSSLQEALRTRLRVVESNSQDVIQLFKDLSARLMSVHAEKDSFVLTFKTVEEVWKFSTYLALGSFFAKALCGRSDPDQEVEVEEELSFQRNDLLMVRDTGQEGMWEGTLLSTGVHGLVPVKSMQPLPYPFYQWFLRKYPGMAGCSPTDKEHFEHPIVSGTCVAVEDYSPLGRDELQLSQGDVVEIQGLLVRGLDMFIGTHASTGHTGFVRKAHVRPLDIMPLDEQLVFLTEEERAALAQSSLGSLRRGPDAPPSFFSHEDPFRELDDGRSEEELLAHLESVREAAKRGGRCWAHRRACFLLGQTLALYINITAVYLKQRMADKLPHTLEKAGALLLCSPGHDFTSLDELELLNLLLRRSVVQGDRHLEARVCYLASSLFLLLRKTDDALPFIERLQFLTAALANTGADADDDRDATAVAVAPLDLNWLLSQLYHRKYMPFLALASLSLDSRPDHSLADAFRRVDLFVRNSSRLDPRGREGTAPTARHTCGLPAAGAGQRRAGWRFETQRDLCLGLASRLPAARRPVSSSALRPAGRGEGCIQMTQEGFQASDTVAAAG
ncbi:hypothetical protein CRUP_014992 [Coryphaenoides rupestris]|nr:hypothetical protein CRUP_014992 [Coryphaenoides rupestris]